MPDASADSLRVRLDVPPEVDAGATLAMTLRVENLTDRPLHLYLTGRTIAFDVIVRDEAGAVVWRRLHEQAIPMILRVETLAARDTLVLSDTWEQRTNDDDPVAPGDYTVRGEVLAEPEPLISPAVPLRIRRG